MEDILKNIEIIEAYSEGKLSVQEKTDFEERLKSDNELAEELKLYNALIAGIRDKDTISLKEKLKKLDKELDNKVSPKIISIHKNKIRYFYYAAAVFLILLIPLYFLINTNSNKNIAEKYYEKDKGLAVLMSDNNRNLKLDNAMNLYKQGNYKESLIIINELLQITPANDTINYYSGVLNYELHNNDKAIEDFKKTLSNNASAFKEKAEFRLALTYLLIDNTEKAKEIFKIISESSSHLYKEKSEEILNELK